LLAKWCSETLYAVGDEPAGLCFWLKRLEGTCIRCCRKMSCAVWWCKVCCGESVIQLCDYELEQAGKLSGEMQEHWCLLTRLSCVCVRCFVTVLEIWGSKHSGGYTALCSMLLKCVTRHTRERYRWSERWAHCLPLHNQPLHSCWATWLGSLLVIMAKGVGANER